jgi:hypothetical protein
MHFPVPSPGSGQIEPSPHDNVHNDIGGFRAGAQHRFAAQLSLRR